MRNIAPPSLQFIYEKVDTELGAWDPEEVTRQDLSQKARGGAEGLKGRMRRLVPPEAEETQEWGSLEDGQAKMGEGQEDWGMLGRSVSTVGEGNEEEEKEEDEAREPSSPILKGRKQPESIIVTGLNFGADDKEEDGKQEGGKARGDDVAGAGINSSLGPSASLIEGTMLGPGQASSLVEGSSVAGVCLVGGTDASMGRKVQETSLVEGSQAGGMDASMRRRRVSLISADFGSVRGRRASLLVCPPCTPTLSRPSSL